MPKQILLADDSITIQKVISLTFAGEDYKITSVDNGADAVTKAREIHPDIILADVVMPEKNGYEVCKEVKGDPGMASIPVLLLAGTFEPFDEDEAKAAGAEGYIVKPFESQMLIQKVKEILGRKGAAVPAPPAAAVKPLTAPAPPTAAVKPPAAPAPPAAVVKPPAAPAPPAAVVKPPAAPAPPAAAVKPAVAPQPPAPPKVQAPPAVVPPIVPPKPAPVAPAPPKAPPAPPVAKAKPAAPSEEDFWGHMMEEVEESVAAKPKAPAVKPPVPEAPAEEVWDISEFESTAEVPGVQKEEEVWEAFAFEEEGEEAEEMPLMEEEELSVAEEVSVAEVEEVPELVPEPYAEPVKAPAVAAVKEVRKVEEKPSAEIAAAPSQQLTEEQLRTAVRGMSREIIEKIVWEVVPDLAEMLIKEEIKRLQKK